MKARIETAIRLAGATHYYRATILDESVDPDWRVMNFLYATDAHDWCIAQGATDISCSILPPL